MAPSEWSDPGHVRHYLQRTGGHERVQEGSRALLELIPAGTRRVLDLGTGDGRLLAMLGAVLPGVQGVGIDSSAPMLDAARARFSGQQAIELVEHDLARALPDLGRFDAVVSSLAIHHLPHERKRALYAEGMRCSNPVGLSSTSSTSPRRTGACTSSSSRRSTSRSSARTTPTGCSTSRPSSDGCARSASKT